tara:strand:- start:28831 stop:29469 length:639 start_codon:yes stop_codon:yes gene_type:complete
MKILLLGPPGSGKGTQAEIICNNFKLPHISTGNMLREAVEAKTQLGLKAKSLMDAGILISDEVVVGLVEERISRPDCAGGFLFDGFPRTIPQADALLDININLDIVIEIQVPDQEIIKRMSGRRVHPGSGRNYHIVFNPPQVEGVDDHTGEKLIQREDDNPITVKDRLEVYKTQTSPLVNFYKTNHSLEYIEIDGTQMPEEVAKAISSFIKK